MNNVHNAYYGYMKRSLAMILSVFAAQLQGQDIHLSQQNAAPLLVNPALTAVDYDMRAAFSYRDQWRQVTPNAYKTFGFNLESKLKFLGWKEIKYKPGTFRRADKHNAIGLCFYHDVTGDGRLSQDLVYIAYNQDVKLSETSHLTAALEPGINYKKINYSNLLFPSQYSSSGYDPNLPSGESYNTSQALAFDAAAGINYSFKSKESTISSGDARSVNIGFSAYYLNRPRNYFLQADRLSVKYACNFSAMLGIKNTGIALNPVFYGYLQGKQKNILAGFIVKYSFRQDTHYTGFKNASAVSLGAMYRLGDAFIIPLTLEMKKMTIGFSYDINISSLTPASKSVGAFEIMLSFNAAKAFLYQTKSMM